jgi:hypothetical protein
MLGRLPGAAPSCTEVADMAGGAARRQVLHANNDSPECRTSSGKADSSKSVRDLKKAYRPLAVSMQDMFQQIDTGRLPSSAPAMLGAGRLCSLSPPHAVLIQRCRFAPRRVERDQNGPSVNAFFAA